MEKTYSPISEITWDDLRHRLFTPEELEASDIRVAIIGELIYARQHGITIKDIAKKTGLKKSKIKKLMVWDKKPEFDTVIAVLLALGKTIMVTDFKPDGQTEKTHGNFTKTMEFDRRPTHDHRRHQKQSR